MSADYRPLDGLASERLRACHELLIEFESSAARLPDELRDILQRLRGIASQATTRFEGQLASAQSDARLRAQVERSYLNFANRLASFIELLTDGTDDDELPVDLLPALAERMARRPTGHAMVLRAVAVDTFHTSAYQQPLANITVVLDALPNAEPLPPALVSAPNWLSVFDIPRSFRRSTLAHVVVLGHELAHAEDQLEDGRYTAPVIESLALPRDASEDETVVAMVEDWVTELFADTVAVRRFGPAAILAFADYARLVQAFQRDIPAPLLMNSFRQHPVAEMRLGLMFDEFKTLGYGADCGPLTEPLRDWHVLAKDVDAAPEDARREFIRACEIIRPAFDRIREAARALVPIDAAYSPAHFTHAVELAEEFAEGLAPSDRLDPDLRSTPESIEDLYNAAAVVRFAPGYRARLASSLGFDRGNDDATRDALTIRQLDELLARAIEGVRLARDWPADPEA